jgi:hypothetical protein
MQCEKIVETSERKRILAKKAVFELRHEAPPHSRFKQVVMPTLFETSPLVHM